MLVHEVVMPYIWRRPAQELVGPIHVHSPNDHQFHVNQCDDRQLTPKDDSPTARVSPRMLVSDPASEPGSYTSPNQNRSAVQSSCPRRSGRTRYFQDKRSDGGCDDLAAYRGGL